MGEVARDERERVFGANSPRNPRVFFPLSVAKIHLGSHLRVLYASASHLSTRVTFGGAKAD